MRDRAAGRTLGRREGHFPRRQLRGLAERDRATGPAGSRSRGSGSSQREAGVSRASLIAASKALDDHRVGDWESHPGELGRPGPHGDSSRARLAPNASERRCLSEDAARRPHRADRERESQIGARLPREASPVSVGKQGYHNNDEDDPKPGRHSDPFLGSGPTLRRIEGRRRGRTIGCLERFPATRRPGVRLGRLRQPRKMAGADTSERQLNGRTSRNRPMERSGPRVPRKAQTQSGSHVTPLPAPQRQTAGLLWGTRGPEFKSRRPDEKRPC